MKNTYFIHLILYNFKIFHIMNLNQCISTVKDPCNNKNENHINNDVNIIVKTLKILVKIIAFKASIILIKFKILFSIFKN